MSVRLIDFLKMKHITASFTYLSAGAENLEHNFISSLIDTWIRVRVIEVNYERLHGICILKSRGMPHSNKVRQFMITDNGIKLIDIVPAIAGKNSGNHDGMFV